MPHQHSTHRALFHLFFFPFKGPHIYLSMLSRHLKISKPIWHYLHHRRPLTFASVEWVWQAITPMQDIGNLMRICSDKSGRSGGGVSWGRGGGVAAESRPAALQEKTRGLMEAGRPSEAPQVMIHADMSKHRARHQLSSVLPPNTAEPQVRSFR